MKKVKFFTIILILALFAAPIATQATQDGQDPPATTAWEDAVKFIDTTLLKSMLELATNKKWEPAKGLLKVYREVGSCPNAAIAIGKMLITKNHAGAIAMIQLTNEELVQAHKSPIRSTRQVKRSFARTIQSEKKQESKEALLNTFLSIFAIDGLTPSEKATIQELREVVGKGLLKTAAILERVLLVVIEEVGNESPLDDMSVTPLLR